MRSTKAVGVHRGEGVVAAAVLLDGLAELAVGQRVGGLEHQVLEEVRGARAPGRIFGGPDAVPDHLRDHGRAMVLDDDAGQSVVEREAVKPRLRGRDGGRLEHEREGEGVAHRCSSGTGSFQDAPRLRHGGQSRGSIGMLSRGAMRLHRRAIVGRRAARRSESGEPRGRGALRSADYRARGIDLFHPDAKVSASAGGGTRGDDGMIWRFILAIILLGVVVGGIVGFNLFRDKMIAGYFAGMKPPPVTVSTTEVEPVTWKPGIEAIGTARALQGVDLAVETAGIVKEILFKANDQVEDRPASRAARRRDRGAPTSRPRRPSSTWR